MTQMSFQREAPHPDQRRPALLSTEVESSFWSISVAGEVRASLAATSSPSGKRRRSVIHPGDLGHSRGQLALRRSRSASRITSETRHSISQHRLHVAKHPQNARGSPLVAAPPSVHVPFHPTSSSWLNLVERWFAELTRKLLQRGSHKTVATLTADLNAWIETWNDDPRPSVWHKTADQILDGLKKSLVNL
jgi:hypothetical protein